MKIRLEKAKELKDGRKGKVLAEILGLSEQHISNIFNGKFEATRPVALVLVSIKENITVNDRKMAEWLEYYFIDE